MRKILIIALFCLTLLSVSTACAGHRYQRPHYYRQPVYVQRCHYSVYVNPYPTTVYYRTPVVIRPSYDNPYPGPVVAYEVVNRYQCVRPRYVIELRYSR